MNLLVLFTSILVSMGIDISLNSRISPIDSKTQSTISSIYRLGASKGTIRYNFSRVGDSISANGYVFLGVKAYDLYAKTIFGDLAPTLKHNFGKRVCTFRKNDVDVDKGLENGCSAYLGKTTLWLISKTGDHSPIEQELIENKPIMAIVMIGTNDITYDFRKDVIPEEAIQAKLDKYKEELTSLINTIIDNGTIPVLSTIPPRTGDYILPSYKARFVGNKYVGLIKRLNSWIIEFAKERELPYVDYHSALCKGTDPAASMTTCNLTVDGIHPNLKGYDIRNQLVMLSFKNIYDKIWEREQL